MQSAVSLGPITHTPLMATPVFPWQDTTPYAFASRLTPTERPSTRTLMYDPPHLHKARVSHGTNSNHITSYHHHYHHHYRPTNTTTRSTRVRMDIGPAASKVLKNAWFETPSPQNLGNKE